METNGEETMDDYSVANRSLELQFRKTVSEESQNSQSSKGTGGLQLLGCALQDLFVALNHALW